jgi:hypothetical protein
MHTQPEQSVPPQLQLQPQINYPRVGNSLFLKFVGMSGSPLPACVFCDVLCLCEFHSNTIFCFFEIFVVLGTLLIAASSSTSLTFAFLPPVKSTKLFDRALFGPQASENLSKQLYLLLLSFSSCVLFPSLLNGIFQSSVVVRRPIEKKKGSSQQQECEKSCQEKFYQFRNKQRGNLYYEFSSQSCPI